MNENTCFANPPKEPLVMIRYWHLTACDGNACAAALLSYFDYWHSYKLSEYSQNRKKNDTAQQHGDERTQDESLYQFHTDQELVNALFGLFKEDKVREAVNLLKEKRFITVTKNPNPKYKFDRTNFYLLNVGELLPVLEAYNEQDYRERVHQWDVKPKGKRKSEDDLRNIVDGSRNIVDGSRNSVELYHETTSETTTETTPNTWSSQSSDNKSEDLEITSSEKNTRNVSGKVLTKAQIKKDLVNSKLQSPEFIKFFEEIRSKYSLYAGNRFLNHFAKHKSQFYKTLAYRVANEDFTQEEVEKVFGLMTQNTDFSLIEFFGNLKNQRYDEKKILVDFIWVMNDGKISAPTAERKGAKELCGWITENKTTLKEIEDCLLWFPDSGRGYKNSLLSVKSALSEFDRVKRDIGNGRYVGSALNGGYKTRDEKTVETLSQRDYDSTAKDVLAAGKAQKEYLQSLIEGTK